MGLAFCVSHTLRVTSQEDRDQVAVLLTPEIGIWEKGSTADEMAAIEMPSDKQLCLNLTFTAWGSIIPRSSTWNRCPDLSENSACL